MDRGNNPYTPPSVEESASLDRDTDSLVSYSCATLALAGLTTFVSIAVVGLLYLRLETVVRDGGLSWEDFLAAIIGFGLVAIVIAATILFVRRDRKRDQF